MAWQTSQGLALAAAETLTVTSTPATPPTGRMSLWAGSVGGRILPKVKGPSGIDTALQPFLARNKIAYWCVPGNAATVPGVLGYTAVTATGTATARNVATTNVFTRMRRLGYVSAGTAGSLAGVRVAAAQVTSGTGTLGGFIKVCRWGISDAALVAGARTFVGVSSSTAAPANVEPSTLVNSVGMGHGAADTTMRIYYGAGTAQTPIDLGASFPANTTNVDIYELVLFFPPTGGCTYEVTRINTGASATGTLAAGVIPASTTLLTYQQAWRSNNATAAAVGIDFCSDYVEQDN